MTEKKYLKWYNKVGYGSGDIAGNVVYAFLSTFMMFYLTETIGMNIGIVGTLMAASKLFDGVSDIFFGAMIDKTHTKMGKARPWMIYGYIGCAVTLAAIFMVPESWGETAQYVYFFVAYTLLNAVFYTANNIAYASLTALITKNSSERVQLGSIRFIFAFGTSLLIQYITIDAVNFFGGGAQGWKIVAIIYAIIGLVTNTISGLSVKELSAEELDETDDKDLQEQEEKYTMVQAAKMLFTNKYYLMICGTYVGTQLYASMLNMGVYFMKNVLGDEGLLGDFSLAINIPLIIGLLITPYLVKKFNGMYKINLIGYVVAIIGRALVIVAGYMHSIPLMLAFTAVAAFGTSPLQGDLNALIASCSEYTFHTKGKRIDGTMYSCSSFGIKVGGSIGTAMCGWLLDSAGFIEQAAVQTASAMNMLHIVYLWLPLVMTVIVTLILSRLNVEKANEKLSSTNNPSK
ncbi:MAG: MFS transporter [Oscillospiraceae bacterium]|nr:MFS transporter [Oscillospiraceae bacterium]MBQ5324488.1 MFS transporter [Oscillospiraceae bacterium]